MYCYLAKKVTVQTGGRPTKGTVAYSVLEHDRGTHCSLAIAVFVEEKGCSVSLLLLFVCFVLFYLPRRFSDLESNSGAVRNTNRNLKCLTPHF